MHFEDMTKWIERDDLIERLSNHLRRPYEKGASIVADDDMIDNAVRRGMKDIHVAENAVGRCLLGDRSRTTVHLLVNRLSDYT